VRPPAVVNASSRPLKPYLLLIQVYFLFFVLFLILTAPCLPSTPSKPQFYLTTIAVATNQVVLTTQPVITTTEAVPTQTLIANCVASETTLPDGSVLVTSVYVTVGGNSPTTFTSGSGSSSNYGAIIGGVVGGVVALLILISVIWVLWRRNRKMAKQIKENEEEEKRNGIINVEELLPSPYVQVCHGYDDFLTEFILL
jgi:hypothetical protein